jgi:lipopolysaccharide export system protein LptC
LPKEEIVRTEHPVVIRQAPKTVIYATGMLYEKKKRTVTLLHKVRAHYERPVVPRAAAKKAPSVAAKKVKAPVKKVKPNKTKTSAKKADSTKVNQLNTTNTNNARIRRRYE